MLLSEAAPRPDGVRLSEPPWPVAHSLADMAAAGVGELEVEPEIVLGAEHARATLDFLRFLRDATSNGVWVAWRARIGSGMNVSTICHLPPPTGGTGLALNPAIAAWREYFRPDRFTWRAGPGFALLVDLRGTDRPRRTRLEEPNLVRAFSVLMEPRAVREVNRTAFDRLLEHQVVLPLGDLSLSMPVHQRRPPILYRRSIHSFQAAFARSNS